uniref:RIB43A-like with coiled-coils protein 2 n=1 Tax=Pristiophorus japonicus TaxID=55135 RepID=UPI00398E6DC4
MAANGTENDNSQDAPLRRPARLPARRRQSPRRRKRGGVAFESRGGFWFVTDEAWLKASQAVPRDRGRLASTPEIDRPFLDQQLREKKAREDREQLRIKAFDADILRYDRTAQLLAAQEEGRVRALNLEVEEFRARYQRPESRREFELSDPDALRKDRPARVCEDDPRCGPSGMQRFQGEDGNQLPRHKFQQRETRGWLEAQRAEKEKAQRDQKLADDLYHRKETELAERGLLLARMEEDSRRALDTATLNYNMALAAEQAALRDADRRREEAMNLAEIGAHVYGDVLTENPQVALSAFGPHRVVTDRWKGMSPQQLEDIRRQQGLQVEENKMRRMKEAQIESEWERQRTLVDSAAMARQRLEEEEARRLRQELDKYNQQLGREQLAHQEYLDKEVYTNPPSAQYYLQFNSSSR